MSALEERLAAVEDSLKLRITQMEVAVMGALRNVTATPVEPQRPMLNMASSGCSSDVRWQNREISSAAPSAADEQSHLGTPGVIGSPPSAGLGGARLPVQAMQDLVDGDREVRSMVNQLRRQVQHTVKSNALQRKPVGDDQVHSQPAPERDIKSASEPTLFVRFARVLGPIHHPDGRCRMTWNFVLALIICYCGIAVPLEIAFEDDMVLSMCGEASTVQVRRTCPSFLVWFWINAFVDLIFVLDVVLNLRTGYMVEGHFVRDDWLVMRHYLRGSFVFDVVSSFPLNLVIGAAVADDNNASASGAARANKMLRLLRVAKLVKLVRMRKLGTYLEYVEVVVRFNPGLLRIFKLCLISLLCCHWFGCLWWLVSDWEMNDNDLRSPWDAGENMWHPPIWLKVSTDFWLKYWHSFFWGAGMCLGMVPRDIEPVTTIEAVVTIFTMFVGLLLAAFVISSFTSAFASIDQKKRLAGDQLDMIRNYLLIKSVPADLRSRILEYYQYIFTSSQSMEDSKLFQHMPPNLATQLALSVNAKLICKCVIFSDCSNASLAALVSMLVPRVLVPGQVVCNEGHPLRKIYFINRGQVQLLRGLGSENEAVIKTLVDADNIGLDDFARSTQRVISYSARSLTYSDVMWLATDELAAAMEHDAMERARLRELEQQASKRTGTNGNGSATSGRGVACLRKAGNIARLRARLMPGGAKTPQVDGRAGEGSPAVHPPTAPEPEPTATKAQHSDTDEAVVSCHQGEAGRSGSPDRKPSHGEAR